jgi:CheY-like chemotaxis protein
MNGQSILIVEDDKWLAEQYARVLNISGYKTAISLHALAAIEAIDDVHPAAIILDVLLIGSTAFTLLHELQSYGDTGIIPIILCTSLASELSVEDLKSYGINRILDKTTMVPEDIVLAVRSVLS